MTEAAARLLVRLGEKGATLATDPQLDALVDGIFDRAEGRLPHRPVRREALIDRIADVLNATEETPDRDGLMRLNTADIYVVLALDVKDPRALEIAESELMPSVRQAVGRIDQHASFVEQASQRIREKLLIGDATTPPAIVQYRGAGPLTRWVRVVASRIALDLKRTDPRIEGDGEEPPAREPSPQEPPAPEPAQADLELEGLWRTCADEYRGALFEAFTMLSRRERNLLRQRYLDDLDAEALSRLYRVSASMTGRWLRQIEVRLTIATRTLLMEKLSIGEEQRPTLDRLVASQLQPNLPRMLQERTPQRFFRR